MEMNVNEVYRHGDIETQPNDVYDVINDVIETTPNEVYGINIR